ncbi:hypothetical protein ACFQ0T_09715 [Kitasatospora gansuensis]
MLGPLRGGPSADRVADLQRQGGPGEFDALGARQQLPGGRPAAQPAQRRGLRLGRQLPVLGRPGPGVRRQRLLAPPGQRQRLAQLSCDRRRFAGLGSPAAQPSDRRRRGPVQVGGRSGQQQLTLRRPERGRPLQVGRRQPGGGAGAA